MRNNPLKYLAGIFLLTFIIFAGMKYLPDFILGVDSGKTESSNVSGYDLYTNKTLNASFLTPKDWSGNVGIGGEYSISPKGKEGLIDIAVSRSPIQFLMGDKTPVHASLEDYMKSHLAFLTEENIGPGLSVTTSKDTLAGNPAFRVIYTYTPVGGEAHFVEEYVALNDQYILKVIYGGVASETKAYQNVFQKVKDSYRLLDQFKFFRPDSKQTISIPFTKEATLLTGTTREDTVSIFFKDKVLISKVGDIKQYTYWVVPFMIQGVGSEIFWYVALMKTPLEGDYSLQHLDSYFLGDRIQNLMLQDNIQQVVVSYNTHESNQPFSEKPTKQKTIALTIYNKTFWLAKNEKNSAKQFF